MARRKTQSYSDEATIIILTFGISLILVGVGWSIAFTVLVILGFAWYKTRRALKIKHNNQRLLHQFSGKNNLEALSPWEFEEHVAKVYAESGYKTRLTPKSGDNGIDILAEKQGIRYAIQVKKTRKPVGSPVIQTLMGSMIHAGTDHGICVSFSGFTREAERFAFGKNIELVDKHALGDLISKL